MSLNGKIQLECVIRAILISFCCDKPVHVLFPIHNIICPVCNHNIVSVCEYSESDVCVNYGYIKNIFNFIFKKITRVVLEHVNLCQNKNCNDIPLTK